MSWPGGWFTWGAMIQAVERLLPTGTDYVVAAYAARLRGGGSFVAYAKVCHGHPPSYWEAAPCVAKFASAREHPTADAALHDAFEVAMMSLGNLGLVRGPVTVPASLGCA